MRYFLTLNCGHGLSVYRKIFAPHVGDTFVCRQCPKQPRVKAVAVAKDGKVTDLWE